VQQGLRRVVAFGLIAHGVYQLATARYRHMRAMG